MIRTVLNLLRSDAYITVNKNLARNIGLAPATVFSELAAKLKYFSDRGETKNGYIYCTIADLKRNTGLSKDEQDTAIKKLVRFGLLEKKIMKLKGDEAPKRYFKITDDVRVLAKYLADPDSDSEDIELTGFEEFPKSKSEKSIQQTDLGGNEKNCPGSIGKTGFEEFPKSTSGISEIEVRDFRNQTPMQAYNEPVSSPLNKNKEKEYIREKKKTTHTCRSEHNDSTGKNVCGNCQKENISLDELREEAEKIIGEKIWKDKFNAAMKNVTIEKLREHLVNWDIHKLNANKAGAYFIQVLTNDIEPVAPERKVNNQNKIPQRDNFDQRQYTDDELEKFYANLVEEQQ